MTLPLSLRAMLALFCAALFTVLLVGAGVAVYRVLAHRLTAAADDNLLDHCAGLWGFIQFRDGKPALVYDPSNRQVTYFLREATRYYQLYDAGSGQLLLESEDSSLMHLALPVAEVPRLVSHPGIDSTTVEGKPLRFRSALFPTNGHLYLLRVGVSVEEDLEDLATLRKVLLFLLPITTLLAVLGAWWMAGKALRPLKDLEHEARTISINELNRRLPERGTRDELDSLAATFNQVFARLHGAVQHMKQFAAYMSHELRTPLTILRGQAELARREPSPPQDWRDFLDSQLEEFDKLNRLIGRFLLVAKAEAGEIEFDVHEFDLGALTASLGAELTPVAASRGIALHVECDNPVSVVADKGWIERAILNLLDNAIKFTGQNGTIRVLAGSVGDHAIVEVSDTGCGIAEGALPHIFDCFYRASSSQPTMAGGAGLGLTLAKWIIEKHGGTIEVKSRLGEGSVFSILLPLVPTPTASPRVKTPSKSTAD